MPRRRLVSSFLLAVALVLPLGAGCGKKQQLTEIAIPDEGVGLRYDLTPGQGYNGHVRLRQAIKTMGGEVVARFELDVALLVTPAQGADGSVVKATVDNITLDLRLPDGVPQAMVAQMGFDKVDSFNGASFEFDLSALGDTNNVPRPSLGSGPDQMMVGVLAQAVTAALVRIPEQAVKDGDTWDAVPKQIKDDPTVTSAEGTGSMTALARNEAGEELAQLEFKSSVQKEIQGKNQLATSQVTVSFSIQGGFPATVERNVSTDNALIEIKAEWTKGAATGGGTAEQVQAVTDPCDPDYVGSEECAADAGAPAKAGEPTDAGAPAAAGEPTDAGAPAKAGEPTDTEAPAKAGEPAPGASAAAAAAP